MIHRLDPRTKITAVIVYIILLFCIRDFGGYAVAAVFVGGTIAASGVPLKFIVRGMKPIAVILILTFLINMFLYPGTVLVAAGPVSYTHLDVYKRQTPKWVTIDTDKLEGKIVALPTREDIDVPIAEHLIVELYSK